MWIVTSEPADQPLVSNVRRKDAIRIEAPDLGLAPVPVTSNAFASVING